MWIPSELEAAEKNPANAIPFLHKLELMDAVDCCNNASFCRRDGGSGRARWDPEIFKSTSCDCPTRIHLSPPGTEVCMTI